MSIRYKLLFAFSIVAGLACVLAIFGFRGVSRSGDLVVNLYDGPLMAINSARSAHAALNEAQLVMQALAGEPSIEAGASIERLLNSIESDLAIVRDRVNDADVVAALRRARYAVRNWAEVCLQTLKPPSSGATQLPAPFLASKTGEAAVTALDDLVEVVAAYGYGFRMEAESAVKNSRNLMLVMASGIALTGIALAIFFSISFSAPIAAAMRVSERVASGNFTDKIASRRNDELGRLLQSLATMQNSLKTRADEDSALLDRIRYLAHHDLLTGLFNRLQFTQELDKAIGRLSNSQDAFSVLVLDLDKFKIVNDTLGHPQGDELLRQVAKRLKSSLRETDVIARLGGDEFAIIQPDGGPDQRESAIALSIRIDEVLALPFDLAGNEVRIGTSIGIALAPEHGRTSSELLRKADLALYRTKAERKDCFTFFTSDMMKAADARRVLEAELRHAIAHKQLEMFYQPVVDAGTCRVSGVEALVRWRHPQRGIAPPDLFIPLAEETGLIASIGEWILQQVCADASLWPDHITVAINLSAVQFRSGNLFDVILCALVDSGLRPSRLELEITETVLLDNELEFLTTVRQLKNLGIAIALDDFGTGYSSLSYLTKFPFDKIKIDKSFTQGMADRSDCSAVVASVLTLARGLGIKVTAEGVETERQRELLQEAGVDLLQGYLFGRPVPLVDLVLENELPAKRTDELERALADGGARGIGGQRELA